MWTMCDYEALQTFQQVIDEKTQPVVFGSTTVDEATQEAIIQWFKNRKVADNDNFLLYFQRLLSAHETQYNSLLRVQTIQFDPLVTDYMERLISREGQNSQTTNRQGNTVSSDSDKTTVSGSDRTTSETDTNTSNTDKVTGTSNNTQNSEGSGTTNDKSMNAQLPQSSTGAGAGLPAAMNWNYATEQNESQNKTTNTGKQTNTGNTTSTGNSNSDGHSTTTTTGSNDSTTTGTRNGNSTTSETGGSNGTNSETVKERSTGRSGDTPELLTKAVSYISRTNAFFWLVDKLEAAFMCVYE